MISIRNISAKYGDKEVLSNVSLDIPKGSICGVVGLNGAGKTTFFNVVYGLKPSAGGVVDIDGRPLTKKDIAYLEAENYFYSNITGREYLRLFIRDASVISEWNRLFELPLDELVDGYSTGMKRKLAIMATVAQGRPVLILDEPFNGLDLQASRLLVSILTMLQGRATVLISSHIIDPLLDVCSMMCHVNHQRIDVYAHEQFGQLQQAIFSGIDEQHGRVLRDILGE